MRRFVRSGCCLVAAAGLAFGAFGATYYVKPTATGSGDGTSWTDATTIADAIGKADASLAKASSTVIRCS